MRIHGLAFSSSSQESRFRVFFALKRWPLDIASVVFPFTFLWFIQSWRYFTIRGCSCSLDAPEPCEQFRSQAAWLGSFPCTPLDRTTANSLLVLGRWYLANWYHVHVEFLWKIEFVDIGFIMALHACVAVLALTGKQFWSSGQGRRNVLVALRVAQKAQNLLAVFTLRPAHMPSFMDVHFGPSTVYGATVLAWYTVLTAVTLTDSAWLVPLEWASLAVIIVTRNSGLLSPGFMCEVLGKQLLIGVLLPMVLLYAIERIQRREFLRLEAAKLDSVATILQGELVSLAPPAHVSPPPSEGLPKSPASPSTSCPTASTDAPPRAAPPEGCSDACAAGRRVTASHPAGNCDPPAWAAEVQGPACCSPCALPTLQPLTEAPAARLLPATPSAAASGTPAMRKPRSMYTRRSKVQLVSVKIINPPPALYADPSPLLASVGAVVASSDCNSGLIATRQTAIRGCLHLLFWLQDATTSARACLPTSQRSNLSPASQPSEPRPAEHVHVAGIILAAVQAGIPEGLDPAVRINVTAFGHSAHSGAAPTSAAPLQLAAADAPGQGPCGTCLPDPHPAAAAAGGGGGGGGGERGAAAAECWLAGGRATLAPEGEDLDGDIVVCVLPGSRQEAVLVTAGSAARAVVVEAGSGAVLLDRVVAAVPSPAGAASSSMGGATDATHLRIRIPMAGAAPPSRPLASAVHLLLLPHNDSTGHVICNFPLLLAPPLVSEELRSYHSDAAQQFLDTLIADASAASAPGPLPAPPAAGAPSFAHLQLQAECQAFNEIIMGLVWDMLAFSVEGTPLHAMASTADGAAAVATPDPFAQPVQELSTTDDVDSIVSFLHEQCMPATAHFFVQAATHPTPQPCAAAPLTPAPLLTSAPHPSAPVPRKPAPTSAPPAACLPAGPCSKAASLATPPPPGPEKEQPSCAPCSKALTSRAGSAFTFCWALAVVDAAVGTLQLLVLVVRHACQPNGHRPTLLYYVVVLAVYAALLGPLWHYWRQRHLVMLPLLLRMAAAVPYIAGWVALPNTTSTAQRLLLLVLMNGTLSAFYARCIPRRTSSGSVSLKQPHLHRDVLCASSAAAASCSSAAAAGAAAEGLPPPGQPELTPSTSSSA